MPPMAVFGRETNMSSPVFAETGRILIHAGNHGPVWRVQSGAFRLDAVGADGETFVQLAMPGDLLGVERCVGLPYALTARAILPSVVREVSAQERSDALLAEGWQQQHRRCVEALSLRTGSAPERLKQLLLLLGSGDDEEDYATAFQRPSLKDMAAIIDSARETVSRILGSMERTSMLQDRQRTIVRFDPDVLRDTHLYEGMSRSIRPVESTPVRPAARRAARVRSPMHAAPGC